MNFREGRSPLELLRSSKLQEALRGQGQSDTLWSQAVGAGPGNACSNICSPVRQLSVLVQWKEESLSPYKIPMNLSLIQWALDKDSTPSNQYNRKEKAHVYKFLQYIGQDRAIYLNTHICSFLFKSCYIWIRIFQSYLQLHYPFKIANIVVLFLHSVHISH